LPDDIPQPVKCVLFADDGKLSREIVKISDCIQLQQALLIVAAWAKLWQLTLNIIKCIIQHFGRANPKYGYRLDNTTLNSSQYVKNLGITVSSDLTYHKHIKDIVSTVAKKLFIVKSCFYSKDISILKKIITAYIRPSLEYGSVIWNPWSSYEIQLLEHMMYKFMSLAYKNHTVYEDQLVDFDIQSLKRRRDDTDLVMYHKILHDHTRIKPVSLFTLNTRTGRRTNNMAIAMPVCHTSAFLHSFPVRAIKQWNALSNDSITIPISSAFARNIRH
jgi:hypothetical protein